MKRFPAALRPWVFAFGLWGQQSMAGETAKAVATVTAGFVTGITVTSTGSGYTGEPAVTIHGGGGSGATAKVELDGDRVAVVIVLTKGSGYTGAPTVTIESPPKPIPVEVTKEQPARTDQAAEAALALKLGLTLPFGPGLRGDLGEISVRWIPAGRFTMGSPSSELGNIADELQHEVILSRGFFLAETECTQGQWESVMGKNYSKFKGADRPVERVSWEDAVEFCRKLTAKQRQEGFLPEGWEWRLPTEAEWEYAARAGTTGARHGKLDLIGWYIWNSGGETHAVKRKQSNAWGLHDMMGNVWEWCGDWYGEYPTGSVTDPTGPSSGSRRVFRGGAWNLVAEGARSAGRDSDIPRYRPEFLGFRPALSSVR